MNLVKIELEQDGTQAAYLTYLNKDLNEEEFLKDNEDYFYVDLNINPDNHYDYIDGNVIYNKEKSELKITDINKSIIEDLLRKSDKYMLIDNPFYLTPDQLEVMKTYRKELRDLFYSDLALTIPTKPYFI